MSKEINLDELKSILEDWGYDLDEESEDIAIHREGSHIFVSGDKIDSITYTEHIDAWKLETDESEITFHEDGRIWIESKTASVQATLYG